MELDFDGRLARLDGLGGFVLVPHYAADGSLQSVETPRGLYTVETTQGLVTAVHDPAGETF